MSNLRELEKPSKYKELLRRVASIQVRHPFITLLSIAAITLMLIGGIRQVRTVASLEKMMPSRIDEIKAFNDLRDQSLGQDMLGIVLEEDKDSTIAPHGDILSYENYLYVRSLKAALSGEDNILYVYAFSDVIDYHGQPADRAAYERILQREDTQSMMSRFVDYGHTSTVIMLSTDVSADDTRMRLLALKLEQDIESAGRPAGTKIAVTGTPVIQQRLGEVIEHDRETTERISALFVFIAVAIVFGSLVAAFVPMVSIVLSIIWLYGTMGYLDLPISTLAGGVAAMVIGIGVDYSVHLRNKYEYERKKGGSLRYAVEETMANTGYVLTHVTVVTGLAFLAFMLGDMPEMGRFGLLMGIGVTLAFILSVIGLPALFIAEERIISWVKERMKFGVEKEMTPETGKGERMDTKSKRRK
jgi:uncharacterized protein